MDTHPTYNQLVEGGSSPKNRGGALLDRAIDGTPYLQQKIVNRPFNVVVPYNMSDDEYQEILSFWQTHRGIAFLFRYEGDGILQAYKFRSRPRRERGQNALGQYDCIAEYELVNDL